VPPGRPENDTVTLAGGARAAAAEAGEVDGSAEGEGDAVVGDSTGADADGMALEHDATAANDRAASPITSAVRASAARDMCCPLVPAPGE
jgi:hypothetical protein